MTFIVAQLGARMHYAVPRILHTAGLLEHLYTDLAGSHGMLRVLGALPDALRPAMVKRALGRSPGGIPPERITGFATFGLRYARRRRTARSPSETTAAHLWAGKEFCRRVARASFGDARAVYTFNTAGLELLHEAKRHGLTTFMEQTSAPSQIERSLMEQEQHDFPGWSPRLQVDSHFQEYADREREEWNQSDVILCGSEFVREGIESCGGPKDRCQVVPYGVECPGLNAERSHDRSKLRVLTIGAVGLRKGSPYLLAAARNLGSIAVFRAVGTINCSESAQNLIRQHVELTGPVPRSEISAHFAWADVFLLPSLCEGSATVIYEALAAGLPVICTPSTGSVVRDGQEGYSVPVRHSAGIVERIERLAADRELVAHMSQRAQLRAQEFTIEQYGARLLSVLTPAVVSTAELI